MLIQGIQSQSSLAFVKLPESRLQLGTETYEEGNDISKVRSRRIHAYCNENANYGWNLSNQSHIQSKPSSWIPEWQCRS